MILRNYTQELLPVILNGPYGMLRIELWSASTYLLYYIIGPKGLKVFGIREFRLLKVFAWTSSETQICPLLLKFWGGVILGPVILQERVL